jgi:hypothetical protein
MDLMISIIIFRELQVLTGGPGMTFELPGPPGGPLLD